ncbi:YceI family protein [Hymenobacter psychrophilus]|uniref:Polyisoprenoid-binding protein YceI n=1 Tax=Hymenobacter psychrophilus TaxID=651662 RepID=A0A1H3GRU0_9BACT|nr:YceI family protein [Hymenobacter psychrophilus]SDY06033.1 Polyisoprenoid-binding protein YceI [Hymenobacter psychrophilus]
MKFLALFLFLTSAVTQPVSASPPRQAARAAATVYRVGPVAVTWTGYAEVGGYAPSGTVQLRRGRFNYDGRTLRNGRFEFDMTTLDQEQAQLAEHLRGEDFFAVTKYPTAVFELQQVRAGVAIGQLTLRGVTRPVRFPLVVEPRPDGRLRISGSATLDRTQFGIQYNSSSFFQNLGSYAIRNDFKLAFELTAVGE